MLVAAAALLAALSTACERNAQEREASSAEAPEKGVVRTHAGAAMPDAQIFNADDESATLAEAAGEPVLVNLWASWCAPCVKELPTLEALASREGAPRVIAVSQDRAERPSVDAFLRGHSIDGLETWRDPNMALAGGLGVQVMPTTVYYDAQGRELWRYIGDLDWTSEEAARLLSEAQGVAAR